MNIALVPKEDYAKIFPLIEDYLKKAARYTYGRYTEQDIKYELLTKKQQLWIAFKDLNMYGFVVTEVITYPQMKTLIMHFTAGKDLLMWKNEMLKELKDFSKLNDCKVIESYGRKGWSKVFKQDGYNSKFIFYELPVENCV